MIGVERAEVMEVRQQGRISATDVRREVTSTGTVLVHHPERAGVESGGVQREHGAVERLGGFRGCQQSARVGQVATRGLDLGWVVLRVRILVPGDDGGRTQRLGDVERGQPGVDAGRAAAFGEVQVYTVVDDVTGHQQPNLGHMQHRGGVGVRVPGFDREKPDPLQLEPGFVDDADLDVAGRDLSREDPVPELGTEVGLVLGRHQLGCALGGPHRHAGKPLQQRDRAEPVVTVSVGDVDLTASSSYLGMVVAQSM